MQKLIIAGLKLPELYYHEKHNIEDPMVRCKLFALGSAATWYLWEYSEEAPDLAPELAFGLCDLYGDGGEIGYVSLLELKALKFAGIPRVERDIHFRPMRLSELQKKLAEGKHV